MIKSFIRFLFTLAVIAGIIFGAYVLVIHTIETHSFVAIDEDASPDDLFTMEITSGMRAGEIIEILHEEGLIRHDLIARLLVRLNSWGRVQVGTYHVYAGMSLEEMFKLFEGGDGEYIDVCEANICVIIPEGLEIDQIARLMANHEELDLDISRRRLLELWADPEFLAELIEEYWFLTDEILHPDIIHPLEGYFYPIRHEIPLNIEDARDLTRAMLNMTERMFARTRTQMEEHDWSVHQILTFASIIQGETANIPDMAKIAGVFRNRYDADQYPLRSCVTVHYFYPGERQTQVTNEMAATPHPFNTYMNPGLPPGPVNSPQRAAINATLQPEEHDYFFFIGDIFNCVDGETMFSRTYPEHNVLVERYLNSGYAGLGCPTD